MATVSITRGNTLPNSSQKADFHNLIDLATGSVSNIVNADVDSAAAIASSKLNLAGITQVVSMTGKAINEAQGSNIASATTTDIGAATGNYVVVTGTTTITGLGTIQAGAYRIVEFSGALTLTHNGTSLILPGGANITTAAGDVAAFVSEGSGNWRCVSYSKANGATLGYTPTAANALAGSIVQVINANTSTRATTSTVIPLDNTIPQNTEGADSGITCTITPTNASNKLVIIVHANVTAASGNTAIVALFQDSTANALQTAAEENAFATAGHPIDFVHDMTAGTTSATSFKIRYGANSGSAYLNGDNSAALFGGTFISSITVLEVKV